MGAKKRPSYRVVVKEKLTKRDGAYLENVGIYNPVGGGEAIRLNLERVEFWINNGAQPTETVRRLINNYRKTAAVEGC
jgi:small subunit ribosomal protein S16